MASWAATREGRGLSRVTMSAMIGILEANIKASIYKILVLLDRIVKVNPKTVVHWLYVSFRQVLFTQLPFSLWPPGSVFTCVNHWLPWMFIYHTKNMKYLIYFFLATCLDGDEKDLVLC